MAEVAKEKFSSESLPQNKSTIESMSSIPLDTPITSILANHISQLWKDPSIELSHAYISRSQRQREGIKYLIQGIGRLSQGDCIPTLLDSIHAVGITGGTIETVIPLTAPHRIVIDCGESNIRRKWLSLFHDVKVLLFMIDLDLPQMSRDHQISSLRDSIQCFFEIGNNPWFIRTPIVVFFFKGDRQNQDHFDMEKFREVFPSYNGEDGLNNAEEWIVQRFRDSIVHKRLFYTQMTSMNDPRGIVTLYYRALTDIIVAQDIERMGLG